QAVDVPAPRMLLIGLHDSVSPFRPSRPVAARAHGNLQHRIGVVWPIQVEIMDKAAVDLELAQVVIGRHIPATIPAFVANAKKADLVRSRMTIGSSLLFQCRWLPSGHVFKPVGSFVRSA